MKKLVSVSCPMDCPDLCRFNAHVESGRITKLVPDRQHPVTRGFACKKGLDLVRRMYHPERIKTPLIKTRSGFEPASYETVISTLADKISRIKETYGPEAILNYSGTGGYGGIKDRIQSIFFNCFGGATVPRGSICWGAGLAAQKYDFGQPKGHDPDDILNADFILVWGRNPKYTNIHLYSLLRKAYKKGSRVIVIDPVRTATAKSFNEYVRIQPSTDGAFALGMCRSIIEKGLHNVDFIKRYVVGFNRFESSVEEYTPERVETITGVPAAVMEEIAAAYAQAETASIYIGFGLQRYLNGGSTIRCIDALGSITGRIGEIGGGVNYAAKSFGPYLFSLEERSRQFIKKERTFVMGRLGAFLEKALNPPVKAVFVHAANPLNQSPDLNKTVEQFKKIELKVVFDHFMTDTARHADIIIPAAFVFEQEDLFVTGMYSPILNHSKQAVNPPDGVMPEFEFYLRLAEKLGLNNLGFEDTRSYLEKSVAPFLEKEGVEFSDLTHSYPRVADGEIPWKDKKFMTPSGKIELYSKKAEKDGLPPLPEYRESCRPPDTLPLRLLTCHTDNSIHSQGFAFKDQIPEVFVNAKTAETLGINECSNVMVKGRSGQIRARLVIDDAVDKNIAFIYQGWWHKSGAVNFLTDSGVSDMGGQAAYYDSFCTIEAD